MANGKDPKDIKIETDPEKMKEGLIDEKSIEENKRKILAKEFNDLYLRLQESGYTLDFLLTETRQMIAGKQEITQSRVDPAIRTMTDKEKEMYEMFKKNLEQQKLNSLANGQGL